MSINPNHSISEHLCAHYDCIFSHLKILIVISATVPYANIQSVAVTFGNKKSLADRHISPLLEERLFVLHVINNSMEQLFRPMEASPEHVARVGTTGHKVVDHNRIMVDDSIPLKCQTTHL